MAIPGRSGRLRQRPLVDGKLTRDCCSPTTGRCQDQTSEYGSLYNLRMNENFFTELSTWLTQAGLAGTSESEILSGFCDHCVAAGLPLGRGQVFIDTLHPVHEGRMFRWGFGPNESPLLEYGRTSPDALAASGYNPEDVRVA